MSAVAAATPPASGTQDQTAAKDAYIQLLERRARGDAVGAVNAVLSHDAEQTRALAELVVEDLEAEMRGLARAARGRRPVAADRQELDRLRRRRLWVLKLTLVVHTESTLKSSDPRQQLAIARDAARRLLQLEDDFMRSGPLAADGGDDWPAVRLLVRDWYLLVVSHLQATGHIELLRSHVVEGLTVFEKDPELLLARGSVAEGDADTAVVDESLAGEIYVAELVHHWRQRLSAAGRDYQEAFKRRPDLMEAHLRWGRVNSKLGNRSDATKAFERVRGGTADQFLRYLAELFLADVAERERDLPRARSRYQRALNEWPTAQAPKLSLSRLCDLDGDAGCARTWLVRSMSEVRAKRQDPWWDYQYGQAWRGGARLESFLQRGLPR